MSDTLNTSVDQVVAKETTLEDRVIKHEQFLKTSVGQLRDQLTQVQTGDGPAQQRAIQALNLLADRMDAFESDASPATPTPVSITSVSDAPVAVTAAPITDVPAPVAIAPDTISSPALQ